MNGYRETYPCGMAMNQGMPGGYQGGGMTMPMTGMTGTQPGMTAPITATPISAEPMPTGLPTGPAQAPLPMPTSQMGQMQIPGPAAVGEISPAMTTATNPAYLAGLLRTQIGRRVRVEFLIGTNGLTDRTGFLRQVGISYIILQEPEEDNLIVCDLYSIKFVTIYL